MDSTDGKITGVPPSHSLLFVLPSSRKLLPRGVEPVEMNPKSKVTGALGEGVFEMTGAFVTVTPSCSVAS